MKCAFGRLSSRFSEYGFQALRCADKTSNTFSYKHGEELIRNTTSQLELEAISELVWPSAKRGAARGQARAFIAEVCNNFLIVEHTLTESYVRDLCSCLCVVDMERG